MNQLWSNFQRYARLQFRRSETGQMVQRMAGLGRSGVSQGQIRDLRRQVERMTRSGDLSEISELARYARGSLRDSLFDAVFGSLGPLGSVLRSLIRPRAKAIVDLDQELQAAVNLLGAFRPDLLSDEGRQAVQFPPGVGGAGGRGGMGTGAGAGATGSDGTGVSTPPGGGGSGGRVRGRTGGGGLAPPPPPVDIPQRPGFRLGSHRETQSNQTTMYVGGRARTYRKDDPILTGEMIDVESSNVHSIGFRWNHDNPMQGTILVRFLQKGRDGVSMGPGPLYEYYGLHPDVFEAFQRAASKGEWVWDRLRIRGTVSGHRVPYKLTGIVNGYLPRQAKRYGPNEYFVGRRLTFGNQRTGQMRTFESALPDQLVNRGQPNRALPERGQPNRGAPNRGRP